MINSWVWGVHVWALLGKAQGAKTYSGKNARERVVGMDVTTACTPCTSFPNRPIEL